MTPRTLLLAVFFTALGASGAELPRSAPEAQGVSARGILQFVQAADERVDHIHSMVIVRHGRIVAESYWAPFTAEQHQMMYSLSKSFTSTAVGLAIAEGKFDLYDPVLKFFPDKEPPAISHNLRAMRIHDLLRMSSGQSEAEIQAFPYEHAPDMVRAFLAMPVASKPGTFWFYNSSATFMLSAIVQRTTGQTVLDYLTPRLFAPLGFEAPTWEQNSQGIKFGYTGLRIRTRDIARFGQLLLQHGRWEGRQLVPAAWLAAATSFQASNGGDPGSDWEQGYGYQFWRCRHGAFRGDGAYGQFCVVMPAQDAVVALTSGTGDLLGELNLVWTYLLPSFGAQPLPSDPAADQALSSRVASLEIPPAQGGADAPPGVAGRTYRVALNGETFNFTFQPGVVIEDHDGSNRHIAYAPGRWHTGPESAVSGAWVSDHELLLKSQQLTLPFLDSARFTFHGDEVTVSRDEQPHPDTYIPVYGAVGRALDSRQE